MTARTRSQLRADRRTIELRRAIGTDLRANRQDQGISQQRLADAAGIDRGYLARIEAGVASASIGILERVAAGLGGDLSLRFYPETGSTLRDRYQAAITEALIRTTVRPWRPALEVAVYRPARGVVDVVLARPGEDVVVAVEVHSQLRRLEQLLRWSALKRDSLPSSAWWRVAGSAAAQVSALLVVRVTEANRRVVGEHGGTVATAFPARAQQAYDSLTTGTSGPGPALLWADYAAGRATIRATPPRGVEVGR